jgi:hypothetical protein
MFQLNRDRRLSRVTEKGSLGEATNPLKMAFRKSGPANALLLVRT